MDRMSMIKEVFKDYKVLNYKDFTIALYNALVKEGINVSGMNTLLEGFFCRDDNQYGKADIVAKRLGLGYPFAGQTFGGYPLVVGRDGLIPPAHHIPDMTDVENYIILNAAHVGLSKEGKWGEVERYNRKKPGASCGYLMNVLNSDDFESDNLEMREVYKVLKDSLDRIRKEKIPEVEIAKEVSMKSREVMDEYIKKASLKEEGMRVIYVNGVNVDLYPDREDDEKNVICVDCVEIYKNGKKIKEIEL